MSEQPRLTIEQLALTVASGDAIVVASDRAWRVLRPLLSVPRATIDETATATASTWIVAGGGTLMDEVKLRRLSARSTPTLVAVPTVWGSGAEVSPFSVTIRDGRKHVTIDPRLVPSARVIMGDFLATLSPRRTLDACADVWAHSLEAFLSPVASDEVKKRAAVLMTKMLDDAHTPHLGWFEWSAQACLLQASSSVGLVHGMAHALEVDAPNSGGHAGLCATMLWPVMQYNTAQAERVTLAAHAAGLDWARVLQRMRSFFDPGRYAALQPVMVSRWRDVLRDPCTRTNVVLVRPSHLEFFTHFAGKPE